MRLRSWLRALAPGILVAATGVGAGDLATASLTGSTLGLAILWAVLLGAFLKFVLNEGLARWQLATGTTLIEGCVDHLGRPVRWILLIYIVAWSFFVSAALMSAVGVTCHAIFPLATGPEAASTDKVIYGVLHSLLAVALIRWGGYALFEKVMSVCIAIMFCTIVTTAVALQPDVGEVLRGLCVPVIPAGGTIWTVALIGGVGGTVTVLCYGYWIREEGRTGPESLDLCRVDLAFGYLGTAIFGLAMVVIGNSLGQIEGSGAALMVRLADRLESTFGGSGTVVRWGFLLGAWSAVFSSLLGVWQSVPYLFADLWQLIRGDGRRQAVDTSGLAYRGYLYAIAVFPMLGTWLSSFRLMQQTYAVVGAAFIPLLAVVLLVLNGRADWVGPSYRNSKATVVVLLGALAFFVYSSIVALGE
jgi:Mn2+/Fe2+ NRAMP family transporter